ncbi:hypothetical protein NQ318_012097 [Aromia moschata]|uniref:Uncharacterized protein n=1 Tax=Aromia moschata TaxID=1265417 RepID=A0AAV8X7V3_9CUCU|nr:hypothetical protein NQ318_012097 [Aromia moschata]
MATVPCTLFISIEDKVRFPVKMVLVVMKQIFCYGVKEITLRGDKIIVALTYSPKTETLTRKFGNLPIKYVRTKLENVEELKLFEKAVKTFTFDIGEDEHDVIDALPEPPKKRLRHAITNEEITDEYLASCSSQKHFIEEPDF